MSFSQYWLRYKICKCFTNWHINELQHFAIYRSFFDGLTALNYFTNNVAPIAIISVINYPKNSFTNHTPKGFMSILATIIFTDSIKNNQPRRLYLYYKKSSKKPTLAFKQLTIELQPDLQANKINNDPFINLLCLGCVISKLRDNTQRANIQYQSSLNFSDYRRKKFGKKLSNQK